MSSATVKWLVDHLKKRTPSGGSHQFAAHQRIGRVLCRRSARQSRRCDDAPWCYKTRVTGFSLGEVCWELGGHMMALCHCATIYYYFFFADKAVSTLCVQIHFTDGATTKPFVKMTRGKCEFVQLVQNKRKKKKRFPSCLRRLWHTNAFIFIFIFIFPSVIPPTKCEAAFPFLPWRVFISVNSSLWGDQECDI